MANLSPATPSRGGLYRTFTARRTDRADEFYHLQSSATNEGLGQDRPMERRCMLRIHDEQTSKEEVVLNLKLFSRNGLKQDELVAIVAFKNDTTGVRDFQSKSPTAVKTYDSLSASVRYESKISDGPLSRDGQESCQNADDDKRYVFAVKDMSAEMRTKQPQTEISISKHVADAFGFKNRSTVLLTIANVASATASHVELSFKDEYLARSDMWRLTVSELSNKTVYKGQRITFMETIKATVAAVYVAGRKVRSAFFSSNTKPIFRSESARFVLFIQMSREMWDFDSEGSGEIMFTKVVNGFLPALFRRWVKLKARHLVSIVLFTRVEYDTGIAHELDANTLSSEYYTGIQADGNRKPYKDFYRVVVSEMASGEWAQILEQLKKEFRFFRHDISMQRLKVIEVKPGDPQPEYKGMGSIPGTTVEAEPSLSVHGNILEAINLASSQFSQDHIDRDLVRTGISIVIISPGTGIFEVDYERLRDTTEMLISTGIGIDLVCLPKIPLHSVPLFRYRNPQYAKYQDELRIKTIGDIGSTPRQSGAIFGSYSSMQESFSPSKASGLTMTERGPRSSFASQKAPDEWSFAIPHWLDVSFWTGASQDQSARPGVKQSKKKSKTRGNIQPFLPFAIRCKMYELEMSGEISGILEGSVPSLRPCINLPVGEVQNGERENRVEGFEWFCVERKHTNVFETFNHARFPGRSTPLARNILDALDAYDREKAFHSKFSPRKSKGDPKKNISIPREKTVKTALAKDPTVFGTSFSSTKDAQSGMSLVGAAMSARKRDSEVDISIRNRKDSQSSSQSKATSVSSLLLRAPKASRQISLGARGFGIVAPKAAVATLQVENVNAATVSTAMGKTNSTSSSAMVHHLFSDRGSDKSDRPASSQGSQRSMKSPAIKAADAHFNYEGERARPIAIKPVPLVSDATASNTIRSKLGSVYERTETAQDPEELPTLEKLKSSDTLRASKAKLFTTNNPIDLSTTLSPTTALSPWLNVLNPSNPKHNQDNIAGQYKRWQHIFPRPNKIKAMKWKSLCSPASVPLTTEYFPTKLQLDKEYEQTVNTLTQFQDDDLSEEPKTKEEFLRELVGLRLSQGFQIVVGPAVAEAFGQKMVKIADAFAKDNIATNGGSIFMSLGNVIHQLSSIYDTGIEVKTFSRKVGAHDVPRDATYKPGIRTTLAETYESRQIALQREQPESNWNTLDRYVAGYDEDIENLKYWRARFVLIPIEHQKIPRRRGEDTEEEVRLEGIRILTQMWQRHRYDPSLDRSTQFKNLASRKIKNPNPLDIVYRTQDPSVVVNQELETLPLEEGGEIYIPRGKLLSSYEPFRQSKLDTAALAEAIQAPLEKGGVRMQNRRWHLRLHYNCFIGSDMTTWLLENFDDLRDRDEAVELGNRLMFKEEPRQRPGDADDASKNKEQGIFVHVEKRHPFRDGQYFYQVAGEHAKMRPETRSGWGFTTRRKDVSIPSTPMTEASNKDSPKPGRLSSSSGIDDKASDPGGMNTPTASANGQGRPKFYLSKVIKYNVDPKSLSYRPERINLHYDRLHNPDNCYHIRIDWMNVTAKLIEDAIQSWAKTAERHNLRLIEVPIAEASCINTMHPFRSPFILKLALSPPDKQPPSFYDATSLGPMPSTTKHFYQKAVLKKHDFVLDVEAASYFPSNVDVAYSWGKPNYRYTQYIHRSGIGLAQITDDGDFLLLANKLYNNRAVASKEAVSFLKHDNMDFGGAAGMRLTSATNFGTIATNTAASPMLRATQMGSPTVSPMLRASHIMSPAVRPTSMLQGTGDVLPVGTRLPPCLSTPDKIKQELVDFCSNVEILDAFYRETLEKASNPPIATPHQKASVGSESSTLDMNIPSFGLGPSLLSRDASPAPLRLSLPIRRQSQHPSDAGSGSMTDSPRGFSLNDDR